MIKTWDIVEDFLGQNKTKKDSFMEKFSLNKNDTIKTEVSNKAEINK